MVWEFFREENTAAEILFWEVFLSTVSAEFQIERSSATYQVSKSINAKKIVLVQQKPEFLRLKKPEMSD